jgi:hypothetical protein
MTITTAIIGFVLSVLATVYLLNNYLEKGSWWRLIGGLCWFGNAVMLLVKTIELGGN